MPTLEELEVIIQNQKNEIEDLKWQVKKLTIDLSDSQKEAMVYAEERDSAYSERNEARECEEIFNERTQAHEATINKLRKKLEYCYNKAYILYHTPHLDQCQNDIWKLWDAVEEFKPL